MQPEKGDPALLWDMLDASKTVVEMTRNVTFENYMSNRMMQLAVERAIEIIGEAARGISNPFKDAHSDIPWQPIIAQRHILAHEYGEIQQERIWRVATIHVPALIAQLAPLVPPVPPDAVT